MFEDLQGHAGDFLGADRAAITEYSFNLFQVEAGAQGMTRLVEQCAPSG